MKYACLVYPGDTLPLTATDVKDFIAVRAAMQESGVYVTSTRLKPVESATTVRIRDGEAVLTDGPFAEIKEHLGGVLILDCADLDEAVAWVVRLPGVRGGAVEIRPMVEFPD